MVCLRNMCVDTLHKGENDDDDDDDNNNNNNNNNVKVCFGQRSALQCQLAHCPSSLLPSDPVNLIFLLSLVLMETRL